MNEINRRNAIIKSLRENGRAAVSSLADQLGASEATVRRDLRQLAQAGVLRRVHGGAVSLLAGGDGVPFHLRAAGLAPAQDLLAQAVNAVIRDGESVALGSGTTCAAVARALVGRRLTVMPFSVQSIQALYGRPETEIIVPGGAVQRQEGSILGPLAEASVRSVRFDTAVLSPYGVAFDLGLTAFNIHDAAIKRRVLDVARKSVFVADGSKFSRVGLATICPLNAIDVLVTDRTAPFEVLTRLRAQGVEVIVADS